MKALSEEFIQQAILNTLENEKCSQLHPGVSCNVKMLQQFWATYVLAGSPHPLCHFQEEKAQAKTPQIASKLSQGIYQVNAFRRRLHPYRQTHDLLFHRALQVQQLQWSHRGVFGWPHSQFRAGRAPGRNRTILRQQDHRNTVQHGQEAELPGEGALRGVPAAGRIGSHDLLLLCRLPRRHPRELPQNPAEVDRQYLISLIFWGPDASKNKYQQPECLILRSSMALVASIFLRVIFRLWLLSFCTLSSSSANQFSVLRTLDSSSSGCLLWQNSFYFRGPAYYYDDDIKRELFELAILDWTFSEAIFEVSLSFTGMKSLKTFSISAYVCTFTDFFFFSLFVVLIIFLLSSLISTSWRMTFCLQNSLSQIACSLTLISSSFCLLSNRSCYSKSPLPGPSLHCSEPSVPFFLLVPVLRVLMPNISLILSRSPEACSVLISLCLLAFIALLYMLAEFPQFRECLGETSLFWFYLLLASQVGHAYELSLLLLCTNVNQLHLVLVLALLSWAERWSSTSQSGWTCLNDFLDPFMLLLLLYFIEYITLTCSHILIVYRYLMRPTLKTHMLVSLTTRLTRSIFTTGPKSYYDILGVPRKATPKQIKDEFLKKARELHPDLNPSPQAQEQFKILKQAYQNLKDPQKRYLYDSGINAETTGDEAYRSATNEGQPGTSRRYYENKWYSFRRANQNDQRDEYYEEKYKFYEQSDNQLRVAYRAVGVFVLVLGYLGYDYLYSRRTSLDAERDRIKATLESSTEDKKARRLRRYIEERAKANAVD